MSLRRETFTSSPQRSTARQGEPPHGDLKVSEVARMLGVSEKRVRSLIKRGELSAYRLGPRGVRVRPEDLDTFREAHRIRPQGRREEMS